MGGGVWMQRVIRAGDVEEKYRFFAAANAKPRGKRRQKCSPRKQDVNEFEAVKRLARLLNCNFRHRDSMITLTWDGPSIAELGDPADVDQARAIAERVVDKFIERLRYHLRKAGKKLDSYVSVVADINGDTGEIVRPHAHLVLPASVLTMRDGHLYAGKADLEKLWGRGGINLRTLHDQPDLTPIAVYLMRQVRRQPDKAKYKAARGMRQPVIVDEEMVSNTREIQAPKGARVLYRSAYEPGKPQYIRYEMPRKRGGKRE